jgi:hypothetical protein
MKQYLRLAMASLVILSLASSCKKSNEEVKYITLNETVAFGAVYNLDLRTYGDADDVATITKQSTKSNASTIAGAFGYSYTAPAANVSKTGSTDKDAVEITLTEGSRGGGRCGNGNNGGGDRKGHDERTVVTINFTIQ